MDEENGGATLRGDATSSDMETQGSVMNVEAGTQEQRDPLTAQRVSSHY